MLFNKTNSSVNNCNTFMILKPIKFIMMIMKVWYIRLIKDRLINLNNRIIIIMSCLIKIMIIRIINKFIMILLYLRIFSRIRNLFLKNLINRISNIFKTKNNFKIKTSECRPSVLWLSFHRLMNKSLRTNNLWILKAN